LPGEKSDIGTDIHSDVTGAENVGRDPDNRRLKPAEKIGKTMIEIKM
jgi:hypothetical protein